MIDVIRGRIGELEAEIVDRKVAEEKLRHQAAHDPITGLPNRHWFDAWLGEAIAKEAAGDGKMAFLYFDIDRFKQVNDVYGHQVGDVLLKEFAERIRGCISPRDAIARLGGDEFAAVLTGVRSRHDVTRTIRRMTKALEPAIPVEEHSVFLSASIGIAMFPQDGRDVRTLIANADVALLQAKNEGRNHFTFYQPKMNRELAAQMSMVHELRQAIAGNELELHYQPIVDVHTRKNIGMEALLRWRHPTRGLLAAGEFIPVAEHHGVMRRLGEEVLRTVLAQQSVWRRQGAQPPFRVAVNLSPREFTDDRFVDRVKRLLAEYDVPPQLLEFEIVESLAMENVALARDRFKALRKLGITISIDDFGMGYSSLSYLKDLPVDNLKIDQSFIKRSMTNEQDRAIVKTIVSLGHSLHLNVIAEGVESEAQFGFLRDVGCDWVQGYHIARPMPSRQLAQWASRFSPIV
ncbi:MAG TPA: EAL domain-containing protein [Candidatus Paceibacterota bacterium]|nr:EAL domain-containing protein [Candidatus Paceibacterota bacterium]